MHRAAWPLSLAFLTACTEWHPVALPTPADSTWSAEGRLRMTTVSGRELRGVSVTLRNDSLVLRPDSVSAELGVPKVAVTAIERRRFSGAKTAVLGVAIVGVSVFVGLTMDSIEPDVGDGMALTRPVP